MNFKNGCVGTWHISNAPAYVKEFRMFILINKFQRDP